MSKPRTPIEKAKRKLALQKNERARYEKLIKENPNHKDFDKWKSKLQSI